MKKQIREADLSDLSSIHSLIEKSYLPFKTFIPSDHNLNITETTIKDLITNENNDVMVAINEKDIIGVFAGIIASRSTYHLKLLFVHPNFQNQGIATFLLNEYETKGIENGYSLLTTNYQKWAVWSLNFYLKHGYKEYEDKDELLFDELKDSVNKLKMIGRFNTRYKRYLWKKI